MPELNNGILPAIAEAAPELAAEVEKDKIACGDVVFTLAQLDKLMAEQGKEDPGELIKSRFLCKQGAAILAAQTGCGKSSFVMQMIFNFALGRPCFGLSPVGELKTLLIQGENDQRDLHEEVSGIARGLAHHELLAVPQLERAKQAVTVRTCTSFAGMSFITHLDEVLTNSPGFDLLVIDPLFSFAGIDIGKEQGAISQWLRNGLNTILRKHDIGAFIVHHANKPGKAFTPKDKNFNSVYDYAGSAELANWARAMLVLERFARDDGSYYFRLTAPKRGTRLDGDFCKYLEWAKDGGIYWRETTPPSIPDNPQEKREAAKTQKTLEQAKQAAGYLNPGEVLTKTDFIKRFAGKMLITSCADKQNIVEFCIGQGFIIQRKPKDDEKFGRGASKVVELPPEHSGQAPENEQTELF